MKSSSNYYASTYGEFENELYARLRREVYGEDIGQNSWITADEQDRFIPWLQLAPGQKLLDVACGAGGPALRIAEKTGCSLVGVDIHAEAIATATSLAAQRGLAQRAEFRIVDANAPLPFPDATFDAITCIDAINHLPDRPRVLADWTRLLKPGGRLLFTDPITVTGPLTREEIAIRSSIGFFLFVPRGYDETVIAQTGLRLQHSEDVTENMARIAAARHAGRAAHAIELRRIEGDNAFDDQQQFLEVAARIARERRLSRFVFVAIRQS